jgi:hypothetical protein
MKISDQISLFFISPNTAIAVNAELPGTETVPGKISKCEEPGVLHAARYYLSSMNRMWPAKVLIHFLFSGFRFLPNLQGNLAARAKSGCCMGIR